MLPDMMELRKQKTKPPQLIILGPEISGNKVLAFGFISFEDIRKGRRFWFEKWKFQVTESIPGRIAAIYPVNLNRPLELEIVQWQI